MSASRMRAGAIATITTALTVGYVSGGLFAQSSPPAPSADLAPLARPPADVPARPAPLNQMLQAGRFASCDLDALLASLGPGCHRIPTLRVAASGADPHGPAAASDGNACTIWNAGAAPPEAVVLDLPQGARVSGFVFDTDMTPDGASTHVLETSPGGDRWTARFTALGRYSSSVPVALVFPSDVTADRWRVRTVASPSWVAWREVFAFECPAGWREQQPPPVDLSRLAIVSGQGSCRHDGDCVPNRCCQPTTCVDRARGPRCIGTNACPAVAGPMDVPGSGCLCQQGHCAARVAASFAHPPPP